MLLKFFELLLFIMVDFCFMRRTKSLGLQLLCKHVSLPGLPWQKSTD